MSNATTRVTRRGVSETTSARRGTPSRPRYQIVAGHAAVCSDALCAKRAGWSGRDAVADVHDTIAEPALVEKLEVSARVSRK